VQALAGPLNVFAFASVPAVDELERLGVRRLSIGPQAQRAGFTLTARIAEEQLERRELGFVSEAMSRAEVERLLSE
jgi:2-methylisocitrate lyase-like PEP mutase family enzyme